MLEFLNSVAECKVLTACLCRVWEYLSIRLDAEWMASQSNNNVYSPILFDLFFSCFCSFKMNEFALSPFDARQFWPKYFVIINYLCSMNPFVLFLFVPNEVSQYRGSFPSSHAWLILLFPFSRALFASSSPFYVRFSPQIDKQAHPAQFNRSNK